MEKCIWVFHGEKSNFSSGVFLSEELAIQDIKKYKLSGVLTCYPANEFVYFWAIKNEFFEAKKDHQKTPDFISKFNSASQMHYHFKDGERVA